MIPHLKKTGADVIYNFVRNKGITTVFGYTGGAILPVTDKFHEYNHSIRYIKNINELCVGHATAFRGCTTRYYQSWCFF